MFLDNTKKIICLSFPGIDSKFALDFFKTQFNLNSISVTWFEPSYTEEQIRQLREEISKIEDPVAQVNRSRELFESSLPVNPNISEILNANILTSPISEYDIYGICVDPTFRMIRMYELAVDLLARKNLEKQTEEYNKILQEVSGVPGEHQLTGVPTLPDIKNEVLNLFNKDFIQNIGIFAPERYQFYSRQHHKQIYWLKHQDQIINHVYKYENYSSYVADICARYNIDASSYDDTVRLNSRKCNLSVNDISQEIKDKVLAKYPEDKTLYDSL